MILRVKRHYEINTFNNFTLTLNYDSIASTFGFDLYFNPDDFFHKELFQPGHFHECEIEHNGELLVRGYMVNHNFELSPIKKTSGISGYSLTGVFEDCNIPTSLYPLQSDGKTLLQIAQYLSNPFGINVVVDGSVSSKVNQVYDVTTAKETSSIKDYLSSLASQKNVILSHTNKGELLFTKAKTRQKPVFHFTGQMPSTSISLSFNGRALHSHITAQKQASSDGGNAGEVTIRNPYVPYIFKPKVTTQSSGTDNDTEEAAKNIRASSLKGIKLTIKTDIWEVDGKVIKPNQVISVQSKELYLYEKSNWFIESVSLSGNEKQTIATINCVLPSVYDGLEPQNIFRRKDADKTHGGLV